MTIRHLKVFIAVAESGKMNIAAKNLYLSQPTVSQVIKELEEHYGVLLFERLSKRLYITEAGKRMLGYARKVVDAFQDLEYHMLPEQNREKLRVGASVTVGSCRMPEMLRRFKQMYPGIATYTYVGNTEAVERKLLDAELDAAVVEGRIRSPELISLPLETDELVVFCGAAHPLAHKASVGLKELASADFVMREQGSGTRELFEEFMKRYGKKVSIAWEVEGFEATRRVVLQENCLGVASARLVLEDILDGTVWAFRSPHAEWDRTFQLVYHKNKLVGELLSAFFSVAKEVGAQGIPAGIPMGGIVAEEERLDADHNGGN